MTFARHRGVEVVDMAGGWISHGYCQLIGNSESPSETSCRRSRHGTKRGHKRQ